MDQQKVPFVRVEHHHFFFQVQFHSLKYRSDKQYTFIQKETPAYDIIT